MLVFVVCHLRVFVAEPATNTKKGSQSLAIDTTMRLMKRLIIHGDDINDSADQIDKKLDQCIAMGGSHLCADDMIASGSQHTFGRWVTQVTCLFGVVH